MQRKKLYLVFCLILPVAMAAGLIMFFSLSPASAASTITVTSAADDGSAGTLRVVISDAVSGDTIDFAPSLAGQTIVLSGTHLSIDKDLTITAAGLTETVRISGDNKSSVFEILSGIGTPDVTLEYLSIVEGSEIISPSGNIRGGIVNSANLTIINSEIISNTADNGGGIENSGDLTVISSTLRANNAKFGGGIYNRGDLTIQQSSLIDNEGSSFGGGIFNLGSEMTVTNSTLSGNQATAGGGVYNDGSMILMNDTFSENQATSSAAGLVDTGDASVYNTIIANSTGAADCFSLLGFDISIHNLIEDGSCSPFIASDPKLLPLGDNGGNTLTYSPLPESPVVDSGHNVSCQAEDQRDISRPQDGNLDSTPICDIGAVEIETPAEMPQVSILKEPKLQKLAVGDTAAFSITVKNSGTLSLTNVTVIDQLVPACDKVIGAMGPGAEDLITCTLPFVTESFINTAKVTGTVELTPTRQVEDIDAALVGLVIFDNYLPIVFVTDPIGP